MVKMKTVSNNTLVVLLVGAMFVALLGSVVSMNRIDAYNDFITGAFGVAGIETRARINFTIGEALAIQFTTSAVDWGSGYVMHGASNCILDSTAQPNANCVDFLEISTPLVLRNVGNQKVELLVGNNVADADALIGGNNPSYDMYYTGAACGGSNATWFEQTGWSGAVSGLTTGHGGEFCEEFDFAEGNDTLEFHFRITIPSDAVDGARSDIWTATAQSLE